MGKPAATARLCLPSLSHSFTRDFLLGFAGPMAEAKEIKERISTFLHITGCKFFHCHFDFCGHAILKFIYSGKNNPIFSLVALSFCLNL